MQYRSHSKHKKGQYSGYGVSIATGVNVSEYSEVNVDPPQYVEPTENHTLVASREYVITNNGSTSHRSDFDVECESNPEQHSEKKSWWTTPKKIAAAAGGGLLIAGGVALSILNATGNATTVSHANELVNSTQTAVGGVTESAVYHYSSGSNTTFTTEAQSLITPDGLPSSNGFDNEDFDDGMSTYTPSIDGSTQRISSPESTSAQDRAAPNGVTEATTNLATFEPLNHLGETIVPRYTSVRSERKYNRVGGLSFEECSACVLRFDVYTEKYHQDLANNVLWYKSALYQQQQDYNKAFVQDINAALSLLESAYGSDPAVREYRADIITALQDERRVLMEEQQAINNRIDQIEVEFRELTSGNVPNFYAYLSFQGNSDLHPKVERGEFTFDEWTQLSRVVVSRERYHAVRDRVKLRMKKRSHLEYLASLRAKIDSMKIDIVVIDEDIYLWSDHRPLEDARSEKKHYETELSKLYESTRRNASIVPDLENQIKQFEESVIEKYPEILDYTWWN